MPAGGGDGSQSVALSGDPQSPGLQRRGQGRRSAGPRNKRLGSRFANNWLGGRSSPVARWRRSGGRFFACRDTPFGAQSNGVGVSLGILSRGVGDLVCLV